MPAPTSGSRDSRPIDNNLDGRLGDELDGGKGNDWVFYNAAATAVTVNLQRGTASGWMSVWFVGITGAGEGRYRVVGVPAPLR
jgi:hypothetical protein